MYRVLVVALLSFMPAALQAATVPPDELEFEDGALDTSTPALRDGVLVDETSPLHADGRELLWALLGAVCVDPADPEAWGPDGQRNAEAGPLCLALPCARLLTTEELEHPVLGRPLLEDEWDLYAARYAAVCATSEPEGHPSSGLAVLPQQGGSWSEVAHSSQSAASRGASAGGAASGASAAGRLPGGSFWGGSGGGSFDDDEVAPGPGQTSSPRPGGGGSTGAPPPGSGKPPRGGDMPPHEQQPSPVPLPGSLAMLLAGMAALRMTRR